ncbi:MAG: ABC transporter permease, partial [Anaerolineales bacterium]
VVLSIAVGVLALGLTMTSNTLMNQWMERSRIASHPAHARMVLDIPFDDETVEVIERLPEVAQAEGWVSTGVRWKPSLDAGWQEAILIAHKDYDQQKYDIVELWSGVWPEENMVAVEFNHLPHYGTPPVGATVYFEGVNRVVPLELTGTVRDPAQSPPPFNIFNKPAFYVNMAGLEAVTGNGKYTRLNFGIPDYDEDAVEQAVEVVEDRLERLGVKSAVMAINLDITDPDRSRAQEFLDGLGVILVTMAFMSLGLSVFLVINTVNAIIASQIKQIGIMKTIGGIRRQITVLYLAGVVVYGLLSLVTAIPLGAVGGFYLTKTLLFALNVQVNEFQVLPEMIWAQFGIGLLTPLLAASWPVVRGTAISAREAIGSYGLGRGIYGLRKIDQLLSSIHGIPRLTALTLRNTFRRMGRVALTQLTLIGAGAIFMMVVTTGDSFDETIAEIWDAWGFEVMMIFGGFQRIGEVSEALQAHPEVEAVEIWICMDATAHLPGRDDPGDQYTISLRGVPEDSTQFQRKITAGRTLQPDDRHAMVLNQKLAQDMGAGLGDQIVVGLPGGRDSTWTVVGLVFDIGTAGVQDTAFMHHSVLAADLRQPGQGTVAQIETVHDTRVSQDAVVRYYQDYFEARGIGIGFAMGQIENRELATAMWSLIGGLLQMMSVLMAAVGSIGLSGTLSINVIERRREIGVMRAVGASSLDVARIFMGEGLLLGVVSWVLAVPLSTILAQYFVDALGQALQFPFFYRYSTEGMWMWLGIVVALSLVASWLPAQRAASISVRESLAYE